MNNMNVLYYIIYVNAYLVSLLPMRALYVISDFLYIIIYKMLHYRVSVVRTNLRNSFPHKDEKERLKIEREFYHWFCDYIVETLKLTSISEQEMRRRMRFEGLDEVCRLTEQGKNVSVYMGHYCNWEWVSSFGMHLPQYKCGQIYHELENKAMNRFFLKIRGRFGSISIRMNDTLQVIRHWVADGQTNLVGYISDQAPGYLDMHYWPMFLNQKTPTYTGTERIAKLFDTAVFYMDMKRPRRGYYVATMVKLCDAARGEEKFALTQRYYQLLEAAINEHPAYWLWSHRRWKRDWEGFCKLIPDERERERIMSKL